MPEKPHIPFVPPTFSWDSPNLYTQYKIFKQKVNFACKGLYKDNDAASKVCAIFNWLGDNADEIYKHLHWATDDDKDDLEKVLLAFENYFKPEQNQFHSWYTLGTIYSSQFKRQHDFLMRLREVTKDCSFANADEIVRFLFLMHNQNARMREELLKTMRPTDSLHDALKIARLAEGTIHSEELLKQYLDIVKKDTQIDSVQHNKSKQNKSNCNGNGQRHHSNSGKQGPKTGGNCHNCGSKHPPKRCPAYGKESHYCKKQGTLLQMLLHQSSIPVFTS